MIPGTARESLAVLLPDEAPISWNRGKSLLGPLSEFLTHRLCVHHKMSYATKFGAMCYAAMDTKNK